MRAFSSFEEQGLLFAVVRGLLTVWLLLLRSTGSRVWAHLLWHVGAIAVVHRLSCPMACGIFPDQGLNPEHLHWEADFYSLDGQVSPRLFCFSECFGKS